MQVDKHLEFKNQPTDGRPQLYPVQELLALLVTIVEECVQQVLSNGFDVEEEFLADVICNEHSLMFCNPVIAEKSH